MSETIFIDLAEADSLLGDYVRLRASLDRVRRSLVTPWSDGVAQVGFAGPSSPQTLRAIDTLLEAGHTDLKWRVDFIATQARAPLRSGRFKSLIPTRSTALRSVSTSDLIEALLATDDHERLAKLLLELSIRGTSTSAVAVATLDALGQVGLDRILAIALANAEDTGIPRLDAPFDYDFAPDPERAIDPDVLLVPLNRLAEIAFTADQTLAGELLVGDTPTDVLRAAMVLAGVKLPALVAAELFVGLQPGLPEYRQTLALAEQAHLTTLAYSPHGPPWVLQFGTPLLDMVEQLVVDPATAAEFITTPGVFEAVRDTQLIPGDDSAYADQWDSTFGALLDQLVGRLGELANSIPLQTIAGRSLDEFNALSDKGYELLLALRDTFNESQIAGGSVAEAAARLVALNFFQIGPADWPVDGKAKEFFAWLAARPAALEALVSGVAVFFESNMASYVDNFAHPGLFGDGAVDRTVAQLDSMAFVLELLAFGLTEVTVDASDLSTLTWIFQFAWGQASSQALSYVPGGLGIVKALFSEGLGFAGDQVSGQLKAGDHDGPLSIEQILTDLLIPHEAIGLADGGETQEIVPLQISLLDQILVQSAGAAGELEDLAPFISEGRIKPPDLDSDDYPTFVHAFNRSVAHVNDTTAVYHDLWASILAWQLRAVEQARVATEES